MQKFISKPHSPSITVVIPLYKDEFTITATVEKLVSILGGLKIDYEIILVDDGSPDKSGKIADKLSKSNNNIKTVHHKVNLGYGKALRDGIQNATKKFVFFTDGDGQYDIGNIKKALYKVSENKAVIGYRQKRADGLKRMFISRFYNAICRAYLGCQVKDVNCSFKLIPRDFFIHNKLYSDGGFIDAEIVCMLKKKGYEITQIPVVHFERAYGTSSFLKIDTILNMLSDMREFKKRS